MNELKMVVEEEKEKARQPGSLSIETRGRADRGVSDRTKSGGVGRERRGRNDLRKAQNHLVGLRSFPLYRRNTL